MKLLIAGTRTFNDYEKLKECIDSFVMKAFDVTEIISGCSFGADLLGEKYAKEKNIAVKRFPADWNKHGKAAGPIRNKLMAEYADIAFIFWDEKSRGTKNMMGELEKLNKFYQCVYF